MKNVFQYIGAFCIGAQLARFAVGCSSGTTHTEYDIPDAGNDASGDVADTQDAASENACKYVACTEGIWICESCTCPGMTCMHEYVYKGENPNAPDASILVGTCGEDLECSVECPSVLCSN